MTRRAAAWGALLVAGCSSPAAPGTGGTTAGTGIQVASPAFGDQGALPRDYTCDAAAPLSPPLSWTGIPAGARALALVVDDPDAPGGSFTHWIVLDIPVTTAAVGAGRTPAGGVAADNSRGTAGYTPACPPSGLHHYRFTLSALSGPTGLRAGAGPADALAAIDRVRLASGRLVATYHR